MSNTPDAAAFKAIIDRILRCRGVEDEAKEDTREVYAELKALGYDKTVAGRLVAEIRAEAKNPDKVSEQSAVLDLYREAYHGASHMHAHARVEIIEEFAADEVATRRLDGFGSVQDGRKMSTNGLSAGVAEQQNDTVHVSVTDETAGETAPPSYQPIHDRPRKLIRPFCQNPASCAGVGIKHCYTCGKIAAAHEAEAA